MQPQPAARFCDLRQTEKKGLGIFAMVDIAKGTVISDEIVIMIDTGNYPFSAATWENPDFWQDFRNRGATDIEQAMSGLITYYEKDSFQRAVLDRLPRSLRIEGLSDYANLLFTNCQPSSSQVPPYSILFGPTTCAFNHSCVANASFVGSTIVDDPSKLRLQVRAVTPIEAGTEITVSYKYSSLPRDERRFQMLGQFSFDCACDICQNETTNIRDCYATINRLRPLFEVPLGHEIKSSTPWRFFRIAFQVAEAYEKLGIKDPRFPMLWQDCAAVAAYHSDAVRTHYCLVFAACFWEILQPHQFASLQPIIASPDLHPDWGHTKLGLSRMEDDRLFRLSREHLPTRVLMAGHNGQFYDRILSKEEVEQKQREEEIAALAQRERLAEKAACQLVKEELMEKGKKQAATSTKKPKKKKKQKGKKGARGRGEEEAAETTGLRVLASSAVQSNAVEEGGDVGGDREEPGGKKRSQHGPGAAVAGPVTKKREEAKPLVAATAVAERGRLDGAKVKGSANMEVDGFSVAEAAVAGEQGALRRLRSLSQPPPPPTVMYDEDSIFLPIIGGELSRRYAAYIDKWLAQN